MSNNNDALRARIVSVKSLLTEKTLKIPDYQRPYKWTQANVKQLMLDIKHHNRIGKDAYRLGTIVLHKEEGKQHYNVVDGQQRLVTLILIIKAASNQFKKEHFDKQFLETLPSFEFSSDISRFNIANNYAEICQDFKGLDINEDDIYFLIEKCEVVEFTLKDVSEAFQFFDSQNSRGKDLEPHDLLKAFHLREFCSTEQVDDKDKKETMAKLQDSAIKAWESIDTAKLNTLFADYLYPIKKWIAGENAGVFGKNDIGLFKGLSLKNDTNYPYTKLFKIAHIEVFNANVERLKKNASEDELDKYPFQLDQPIVNGRRFFEMIDHYNTVVDGIRKSSWKETDGASDEHDKSLIGTINKVSGQRTGDKHVRRVFDCLLIYYMDRFGEEDLTRAIDKIFIRSYSLRLRLKSVSMGSVNKDIREKGNFFRVIAKASTPQDVTNYTLPVLKEVEATKVEGITKLFKEKDYYDVSNSK